MSGNDWTEWSQYVLKELEDLNRRYDKLYELVQVIDKRLTVLETKAFVYGTIGGALVSIIIGLIIKFA